MRAITFLATSLAAVAALASDPDWVAEGVAPWQARDSQVEFVLGDRMWIGGGWFDSFVAAPRDVWASADGRTWNRVTEEAAWKHSDLAMSVVFRDRAFVMGGWCDGRLPGHSASNAVWWSADGAAWTQATPAAGWSPRLAAGLVTHRDRMWLLGGTENYYFGDATSPRNDVWSSADGVAWRQETPRAGWSPRGYHQAVVLNGRIYVLGGGNYVPDHEAKNDVWSSADGAEWTCETGSAAWSPRLWFGAAVYRGRMWILGGWSKEHDNFGDVWHSADGRDWRRLRTKTSWKPRHEHSVLVFRDRLWVIGGHARPLSNEVWSLHLPADWQP